MSRRVAPRPTIRIKVVSASVRAPTVEPSRNNRDGTCTLIVAIALYSTCTCTDR